MSNPAFPSDVLAMRFPVSIKGIVEVNGQFVLLKNGRDEWELPGGKLEANEQPVQCLEREILEELNVRVEVTSLLDVWVYNILGKVDVVVVTFATHVVDRDAAMRVSSEHGALRLFAYDDIAALTMPDGYKASLTAYRNGRPTLSGRHVKG